MQHKKDGKRSLRERYNMMHSAKEIKIELGEVVLIKSEEKKKGKLTIGIVETFFISKGNVIRVSDIERPTQYLLSLEIHCNTEKSTSMSKNTSYKKLNVDSKEYMTTKNSSSFC